MADRETEAQRRCITCLRPHSEPEAELGLKVPVSGLSAASHFLSGPPHYLHRVSVGSVSGLAASDKSEHRARHSARLLAIMTMNLMAPVDRPGNRHREQDTVDGRGEVSTQQGP